MTEKDSEFDGAALHIRLIGYFAIGGALILNYSMNIALGIGSVGILAYIYLTWPEALPWLLFMGKVIAAAVAVGVGVFVVLALIGKAALLMGWKPRLNEFMRLDP